MGSTETSYPHAASLEYIELTPAEYLNRFQSIERGELQTVEILPPELGSSGFGKIRVRISGLFSGYSEEK